MGGAFSMFGSGAMSPGAKGGFMNLLGTEGAGLTGSKTTGASNIALDPTTQALNNLRLSSMLNLGGSVGGFETLVPNYMNSFNFSGDTNALINQAIQTANIPGLQPTDWYNQAISGTSIGNEEQRLDRLKNIGINTEHDVLQGNLQGINNLSPQLLGAGNDYFHQILGPQVQNQYSLMGLGRSGANEEAQAKGAASISLPIAQLIAQLTQGAYQQYGQGVQGLVGQNNQAQAGLGQQQLQNIYGINQAYPGVSTGLQGAELERQMKGVGVSDLQRAQQYQGLQTLLQSLLGGMSSMPYTPAPKQTQSGTGNAGLITSVMGGGGAGSAAGGLGSLYSSGMLGGGAGAGASAAGGAGGAASGASLLALF
jgi:hypothetical protein